MFPVSDMFCRGPLQVLNYSYAQFGTYSNVQYTEGDFTAVPGGCYVLYFTKAK